MAISSIKTLVNDGGGGTTSTTNITNTKTGSTSNTNPEAQFEVINPDSGVVSNNIEKYTPTYRLSSIEEFKEAADLINQNRKEAKLQIDELSKNLYSTLNQINFSIKLIIETNGFLTQYTNDEANLLSQLTELLTVENKETTMELSNNIRFNNLFISSIFFFENFSRILIEAISEYLLNNGSALLDPGFDVKVEDIFNNYCEKFFIKNDWESYRKAHELFSANYNDLFSITVLDRETSELTDGQDYLISEYTKYKNIFDSLKLIFDPALNFTLDTLDDGLNRPSISDNLIPSVKNIINFKSGSTIYTKYLDKLDLILNETIELFSRIYDYVGRLENYNTEYQPTFKEDNTYISAIKEVASISIDLLASLKIKYPNRNSKKELIKDESFNRVLEIINNLYRRELESSFQLIGLSSRDYKLIKSLDTFVSTEKSMDNSKVFKIMSDFDNDLYDSGLSSFIRLYFDRRNSDINTFGSESFTQLLLDSSLTTEPMYDLLNYYRLFLFPFIRDTSLIFDLLETLYIYNKSITKDTIDVTLKDMFDIKIANIDYINLNESKINESLTSRFEELDQLNYFDILPYLNVIKQTDLSTINSISDLVALFSGLKAYDLMIFNIIENILYNDIDLSLVMRTLSIKTNIRTVFFKIMFLIAMDKLITLINTYYSNDVPTNLEVFIELNKQRNNIIDFKEDLIYVKRLILARDYYYGTNDLFNIDNIIDFETDSITSIWDLEKIDKIIELFSLYKEV